MGMKKQAAMLSMLLLFTECFGGCAVDAGKKNEAEKVSLVIWGSEETQPLLEELTDAFVEAHKDEVELDITVGAQAESSLADNVVGDVERAADVFCFADDQFTRLSADGDLLPITRNVEEIIEACGGRETTAVQCAMEGDTLYAYPLTASNGYYLYYNAEYFDEDEVQTLDEILEIAEASGKKVTIDYSSGWYMYSFFSAAGLELNLAEDGKTNNCNWNATDTQYTGVDVAEAMLAIAKNPAFVSLNDDGFRSGVKDGSIIAGVNGPWNESYVKQCWGENCRAVKLPTYTIKGDEQLQMHSFMGYKMVGVNAKTESPEWAMQLAEWISNEENQMKRFETTGECPVNQKAAARKEVQDSLAVKAMVEQAPYASQNQVAKCFWNAATAFGAVIAAGNPDERSLQELLDDLVKGATTEQKET